MSLSNNIHADSRKLFELLQNKYIVDYFQREYKWGFKHIEQLLIDLESSFNANYLDGDTIRDVETRYNSYYLGPIVICKKGNIRSIVDGQQRLTSITLLLIYLNNLQKDSEDPEDIENLIYSKKGGRKSYNIEVPDRRKILDLLFKGNLYDITDEDDESIVNMSERYSDIINIFPESLKNERLPIFIEWVKEKIVFVEILAYTDENAYTIFETMNDRGLNLTPTEMLKGYLLAQIKDSNKIDELNIIWKKKISNLHQHSVQEDQEFIKAWLRSQYAVSIQSVSTEIKNADFEKIGTSFHTWVRDNHKNLNLNNSDAYYYFIKGDFEFYSSIYEKIKKYESEYTVGIERLYLLSYWGIASSLSYPLLMASINKLDDETTILKKLNTVSAFIDILVVTRAINYKGVSQAFLRYIIYSIVKEIRNKNLNELKVILKERLHSSKEKLDNLDEFIFTNGSKKFIRYLFGRCILFVERAKYKNNDITMHKLMAKRKQNRFVLTPIISEYNNYVNYFDSEEVFSTTEKKLGNFILIPNPISKKVSSTFNIAKIGLLKNEYNLTKSITNIYYEDLQENDYLQSLGFKAFTNFKEGIDERTTSLMNLIREIWDIEKI